MNTLIDGVLARFSYGCIPATKKNAVITAEVCTQKHADTDAGIWSDKLWPAKSCGKRNEFTELRRHLSSMRSYHYQSTFVYEDEIWRILPSRRVEAYQKLLEQDGKKRAAELLEDFITSLPALIEKAKEGRGDSFKPEDYPDAEQIRAKYFYTVDYRPIPTAAGLNPNLMKEAIEKINLLNEQRLKEANGALIKRFLTPIQLLSEQLKDPDGRRIKCVLETIRGICAEVPTLDMSGNSELIEIANSVNVVLDGVTPELLKKDEQLQKMLGETCANVCSTFGELGKRKLE